MVNRETISIVEDWLAINSCTSWAEWAGTSYFCSHLRHDCITEISQYLQIEVKINSINLWYLLLSFKIIPVHTWLITFCDMF